MDEGIIKKTIAITAPTGMLGSMVYKVLKDRHKLILIYRNEEKLKILNEVYGWIDDHRKVQFDFKDVYQDYLEGFSKDTIGSNTKKLVEQVGEVDGFINCAGLTKPHSLKDPTQTFFINGALPHILSNIYKEKFIHITSDCAYHGLGGAPYDERAPKNPNDFYGLSKVLGEPSERSLVLRTSIIGPEIAEFVLLISWFKKQEGKTIQGFANHFWNGITTREFAKICDKIISNRDAYPAAGLFHVFSTDVSKYAFEV